MQTDFTQFERNYPIKNDFDIRRARLNISGKLFEYLISDLKVSLRIQQ